MNAIVGLCHFCEAHGPQPLFCTFTTNNEEHTTEPSQYPVQCSGCTSLGTDTVLVSRDEDGTIYCSRESMPNADVNSFLRQAAVRSITCEVSWSKEGGVVYFNENQGHVLSFMFKLPDTRARGLKRWFSIVVLMKDKMLLFTITPVLSEHMEKISKEMQMLAEAVYSEEQKVCSQRALRLKTGRNDFGQSRSLTQLTGDNDVYKKLHSHFTCMLQAGALSYSETLYTSSDLLNKLDSREISNSTFEPNACAVPDAEDCMSLRVLEKLLSKDVFRILMYCTLVGEKISLKAFHIDIYKGLLRLIPHYMQKICHISISNTVECVPPDCCILEGTENNNFKVKWDKAIPTKVPIVMKRMEIAMSNSQMNDQVLNQHVKSLQLEWVGIARTMKAAINSSGAKSTAVVKLKQVLGVTQADELLVDYWMKML